MRDETRSYSLWASVDSVPAVGSGSARCSGVVVTLLPETKCVQVSGRVRCQGKEVSAYRWEKHPTPYRVESSHNQSQLERKAAKLLKG